MSSIFDFFSSAIGGGIFGSVLHIATSWFDTLRKGKEADIEIRLMQARTESAEKTEAWKAFTESQKTQGAISIPANAHPVIVNLYLVVDAFSRVTRPGLTWVGAIFIATVYFTSFGETRSTLASEINFGAWTMMYWWFGARYQKK